MPVFLKDGGKNAIFGTALSEFSDEIERLISIIDTEIPIPPRFAHKLPHEIAELSRLLTQARPERGGAYLSSARVLSAYSRYFLPWNVLRLCALLASPSLRNEITKRLADGGAALDFGSGPATFPLALWIACPELRSKKLNIIASDQNKFVLNAGRRLFTAFTGGPWKFSAKPVRFEDYVGPRSQLVSSINLLNEVFWKIPQADTSALTICAQKTAKRFANALSEGGAALIVEPGIPRASQYLGFLKKAFRELGLFTRYPCPQEVVCPMCGGRKGTKWCHFKISAEGAPPKLQTLSSESVSRKESLTLSFIFVSGGAAESENSGVPEKGVRVISGIFPLPDGKTGRYGCSCYGLTLLRASKHTLDTVKPGAFLEINSSARERDPKTGALIIDLDT
ncbi:MAG: hypothetical protein LBC77_03025 [Spirochaetaceae bacterium]|jgi:ribosomal protein RSM22 (predicted rRNA methylase)|nr:hypothetical protein [Spirochaetaceae bacterium]